MCLYCLCFHGSLINKCKITILACVCHYFEKPFPYQNNDRDQTICDMILLLIYPWLFLTWIAYIIRSMYVHPFFRIYQGMIHSLNSIIYMDKKTYIYIYISFGSEMINPIEGRIGDMTLLFLNCDTIVEGELLYSDHKACI